MLAALFLVVILGGFFLLIILWANKRTKKKNREAEEKRAQVYANRLVQIIGESKELINKSKNLETIISRFDVILDNTDKLIGLAQQFNYPNITNPPPQEIKDFYIKEREKFITDHVEDQVNYEIEKAKSITRKSSKIALLDKAIIMILDGKRTLHDNEKIQRLSDKEEEIRALIIQIKKEE